MAYLNLTSHANMFWLFVGIFCGVCIGQEVTSLPRIRPIVESLYHKHIANDKDDS